MSGAQTSTFPTMNEMLAPMEAYDTHAVRQNQLMQQQRDITDHDIAAVGQAAAPLLGMSEQDAAAAYPGWLQDMQSRGLAKYAPPTYPGHATTAALVQRAMPLLQQIQTGFLTTPGSAAAMDNLNKIYTGGGTPPAAPATGGTGGDGLTGDKAHDLPLIAQRESGGSPTVLNYVARQDPTAYARGATASGKYQIVNSTWREGMQLAGLDPSQYATAREAPEPVQDKVASALYDKYGNAPWKKGPRDWVKDEQGRYQMATVRTPAIAIAGAPATGAPTAPPGGPATPAPYRVASTAPVPPPTPTAPTAQPSYVDTETGLPVIGTQPGAPATAPQSQAQIPQPPPNRSMPGAPDGPPAPTPPPAVAQPPAAPAPRANLPRAADVPSGANSPQVQQAQDLMRRAAQIEMVAAQNPYDKRLAADAAAKAADLKQRAQILMQTDSVVQTQEGQFHPLTGKIDDPTKPLPHYVYDPTQHAYIDTTGTNKPEFEPAQRDSAVAQRDVMELGPKVANGTATPQERARYATAVVTYRQPKVMTDPISKQLIRVNERELPAGFPEPGGSGAAGGGPQPITQGLSTTQQQIERDPAAYKVSETQYTNDAQDVRPLAEAGRQAQADQVRIKEMQDVLQRFSTGFGTEARTAASAFFQRWLPSALTGWEKTDPNLSGGDAAQAFSKLALVGAGTQERGVLGARGGYQAIKLFKDANPSINLQDATNKSILDMQLISNQANQDYTQAALSHFADNEKKFAATHQYDSLTQFDRNWNAQRNPQVYAAAMGAISGQSPEQWTRGLSDAEYNRALDIVSRANPSAVVNTKEGRKVMQPNAATPPIPPGMTVVR